MMFFTKYLIDSTVTVNFSLLQSHILGTNGIDGTQNIKLVCGLQEMVLLSLESQYDVSSFYILLYISFLYRIHQGIVQ